MSKLNRIDDAVKEQKKVYSQKWAIDAQNYKKNNDYCWMSSFINGYKSIVEIGTGDGSSTLSLIENGHVVIGIDENLECLKKTYDTIKTAGYPVKLLHRGNLKTKNDGYSIEYKSFSTPTPENGALLIEGDIINDPNLIKWLEKNKPFDGVICWLIGSHGTRSFNVSVWAETPGAYRIQVQNRVYEVADLILKEKGVLHIVDRMRLPKNEEERQLILDSHNEQASVTSLNVMKIDYRDHFKLGEESVELGLNSPSELPISELQAVLVSISSIKP